MSLGRRLWNVARAEVRDAFKRRGGVPAQEQGARAAEPAEAERPHASSTEAERPHTTAREADVRRWYANLELPVGANADEVRAAYRRMMRRYHPDRHFGDAEAQRVATELVQALRRAYEGLLAHLG